MSRPDSSKRSEFRQSITRSGVSRVDNFSGSVGTAIRRWVTLHTLPPPVLSRVPAHRSDRYILMRDDIVVTDPHTYEIVNMIRG